MHEQEVLRVFFQTHLVNDTTGHRECGDTCRTDHRVDLLLHEQVEELCEQNTACRVKNECEQTEAQDEQGVDVEELVCGHLGCNRDAEEDRDEVCKDLLCGFGQRVENAAFTDQVTEHQEADERNGCGCDDTCDNGDDDREQDTGRLGNFLCLVGHTDLAFLLGGQQLDDRRLNDRHECHVGVCRNHDGSEELGVELVCNDNRGGTVGSTDDGDGCRVVDVKEDGCQTQREENTELCRRTEDHQLGIGQQRTEVDHRADTDEQNQREEFVCNTGIKQNGQRTGFSDTVVNLRDCAGVGQVDENGTEADGEKQGRFHILLDCKIDQNAADRPHDEIAPVHLQKVFIQDFHG